MTPAIATGGAASAASIARPELERVDANASARPQVQSRRLSLKLGPLGISYTTDRVFWTEAVAAAAARALGPSEAKGVAATQGSVASTTSLDSAGQDGVDGRQAQAQQAEATSRAFSLELAQAWRRQVENRVRSDQNYGRDGAIKTRAATDGRPAGGSTEGAASASTSAASARADSSTTQAATQAESTAAFETSSGAARLFATQQESAPASRMRQAIGAYLACARNFGAVPPMLTAVA